MSTVEPELMSVAQARALLGPEVCHEIDSRPKKPLTQEQIDLVIRAFRADEGR